MLRVLGSPRRCCDGITRRETLVAGALTALGGFGLGHWLAASDAGRVRPGRAKSVIVLYLLGGAATQDMWDLKPHAPAEVRGEFQPIATSAPGVFISEHLPKTALWMHRAAIVRTVHHQAGCHNPLPSYSGWEMPLDNIVTTRDTYPPSMGSVCEYLRQHGQPAREERRHSILPDYVYMPCYLGWGQNIRRPGPYAGFLGARYDALTTVCDPRPPEGAPAPAPGAPQIPMGIPQLADMHGTYQLTLDQWASRRSLLDQLDDRLREAESAKTIDSYSGHRRRAYEILTSSELRAAFSLEEEPPELLERYGRTLFGHSTLIARRLVERGVRFVNVTWDLFWDRVRIDYDAWDTHTRNFEILKNNKLPAFDQTFSALLQDLDARGLLEETLVVVMSEMGRTPRINQAAGRDHWTYCYSVVLAGAGIQGGSLYGESDGQAAFVKDKPVSTSDLCATIYHCLGIDPHFRVPDRTGRPVEIAHGGQPLWEILS